MHFDFKTRIDSGNLLYFCKAFRPLAAIDCVQSYLTNTDRHLHESGDLVNPPVSGNLQLDSNLTSLPLPRNTVRLSTFYVFPAKAGISLGSRNYR